MEYPDLVIVKHEDAPSFDAFENLTRKVLAFNGNLMLTEHTMEQGSVFPKHQHPHDQLAYLVSGHIRVEAAGQVFEARAGDSFVLKGGVDHQVWAIEKSVALDVFTPLREDYLMHAAAPSLEAAKAASAVEA
jgi:quercetin dioxygenase-like cupin family protein